MTQRKPLGLLAAAAALAVALAGCSAGSGTDKSAQPDRTLTIGMTSDVATFDPAQSQVGGPNQYMLPVYDTLIRKDDDGKLVPMLATSWKYTDSSNTVFELTIRDGVKFSEAKPIRFRAGERLRLVLVNDTMMNHPVHLHGMWSELENPQGQFQVRKHTINVQPAQRIAYGVTADATGRWAYHCHMLYHMEAGMMREVVVA